MGEFADVFLDQMFDEIDTDDYEHAEMSVSAGPADRTCKRCGATRLRWAHDEQGFFLVDRANVQHECDADAVHEHNAADFD